MKLHWLILIMLVAGVVLGGILRATLDKPSEMPGVVFEERPGVGVVVVKAPAGTGIRKTGVVQGDVIRALILDTGDGDEQDDPSKRIPVTSLEQLEADIAGLANGVLVLVDVGKEKPRTQTVKLAKGSTLDSWLEPFRFIADIFIRLLKMLIVPLILTSIITGVAGLGGAANFRRLGTKTFIYYLSTSLFAATAGLLLVNLMQPGKGAQLGLGEAEFTPGDEGFVEILIRMVPENAFSAFADNRLMLQVIFFSLLFGYFITKIEEPSRKVMTDFFDAAFEVMMKLAGFALALVPYGVFALMVKIVAETGYEVFVPLAWYMLTVFLGLVIHAGVSLPMLVSIIGKVSPIRWFKAMTPALLTAFSTSSSAMTLPVTIETVEKRGKVSNKTSSFVLPLGATINMDGTALYECVGALFLAQYYAGPEGVAFSSQIMVVFAALLASIGAAGIPSAGLVMMLTILSALDLPVEGAALLLAVDRPLDMCRTTVNVWSDTCGTAIIAASENEKLLTADGGPS